MRSPSESSMKCGVSLREKKEHCGAIIRVDGEVRVGTASEGMSRLARLVLLQRSMFERTHLRIEISCRRVIPFLFVHGEAIVVVQRGSLRKRPQKVTIPDSESLTLEGNRGVGQIKQSYPVACVSACVLWQHMSATITHAGLHRGNREHPKPWENVEEREITLIQRFLLHTSPLNPPERRGPEMGRLPQIKGERQRQRKRDEVEGDSQDL